MSRETELSRDLNVEDFRRLGVRPNEVRLSVIRSAASRNAMPLANKLLASSFVGVSGNHENGNIEHEIRAFGEDSNWNDSWLQLSRVATSTYRLLDPRLRPNAHQRAYIGRILPLALTTAGATSFDVAKPTLRTKRVDPSGPVPPPVSIAFSKPSLADDPFLTPATQTNDAEVWQLSLDDHDLVSGSRIRRQRNLSNRNVWGWSSMAALGILVGSVLGWKSLPDSLPKTTNVVASIKQDVPELGKTDQGKTTPSIPNRDADAAIPMVDNVNSQLVERESASEPLIASLPKVAEYLPIAPESIVTAPIAIEPIADAAMNPESGDAQPSDPEPIDSTPTDATNLATDDVIDVEPSISQEKFHVPHAEDIAIARRRILESVNASNVSITRVNFKTIQDWITDVQSDFPPGSVDHYTAASMLGGFDWLESGCRPASLTSMMSRLGAYQVDEADVWTQSYIDASEHVTLPEDLNQFFLAGFGLIESLVKREAIEHAGEVLATIQQRSEMFSSEVASANPIDIIDPDENKLASLIASYQKSLKYAQRLSTTAKRLVRLHGHLDSIATDVSGGSSLGRYHCLVLGDWCQGLRFLAKTSDPRLAALAESELEMHTEDAFFSDATAWIEIANQWNSAAERVSGRSANQIRLHAIELIKNATLRAGPDVQSEADQQAEAIRQQLPLHLKLNDEYADPKNVVAVSEDAETASSLDENPTQETNSANESQLVNDWLVGRIKVDGEDVGVRLRYQLDVGITPAMLSSIEKQLRQPLNHGSIEFEGSFNCENDQWIILAASPSASTVRESILLNNELVLLDEFDRSARLQVKAGQHSLVWKIELSDTQTTLVCSLRDAESGTRLSLTSSPTPLQSDLSGDLTVSITRSSQQP